MCNDGDTSVNTAEKTAVLQGHCLDYRIKQAGAELGQAQFSLGFN